MILLLVLLSLYIRSKYQGYASYVNADKRNTIHIRIQTRRIKAKEGSVFGSIKICHREVQNKERSLLNGSSKDTLMSKANNSDI